MTSEAERRALLPIATVIEDDSLLSSLLEGVRVTETEYQPPEDDPLREFGGFVVPTPLYYSRERDVFFTVAKGA